MCKTGRNQQKNEIDTRLERIERVVGGIYSEKEECVKELKKFRQYLQEIYENNLKNGNSTKQKQQ